MFNMHLKNCKIITLIVITMCIKYLTYLLTNSFMLCESFLYGNYAMGAFLNLRLSVPKMPEYKQNSLLS